MSAADLAEGLDLSIKTINNNIKELIEGDEIETTQIGNATAYYVRADQLPAHQKPDHTCQRCGRDCPAFHDLTKVEVDTYFEQGQREDSTVDFYILCRFCYSDLTKWLFSDDGAMGRYRDVHSWDISQEQLNAVREDSDTVTRPGEPDETLDRMHTAYSILRDIADEESETVQREKLQQRLTDEFGRNEGQEMYNALARGGYFTTTEYPNKLLIAK